MSAFFSALGGFAEGFNQSLQKNQEYAQQAKAAKEKGDADFLHEAGLIREEQRLKSMYGKPEGTISTIGKYPFNIHDSAFKDDNGKAIDILGQFDTGLTSLKNSDPAKFNQIINSPAFIQEMRRYGDQAFKTQTIKGKDNRVIKYRTFGGANYSPWFQEMLEGLDFNVFSGDPVQIVDGQQHIVINGLTTDENNALYKETQELVDRRYGDGKWEKWATRWRADYKQGLERYNALSDEDKQAGEFEFPISEIKLPLSTFESLADPTLVKNGPVFTKRFRRLPAVLKQNLKEKPALLKFFTAGTLDSELFELYLRSDPNTSLQHQVADKIYTIADQNPDSLVPQTALGNRDLNWYKDRVDNLSEAISVALSASTVHYEDGWKVETVGETSALTDTEIKNYQEISNNQVELFDSVDDLQKSLMGITTAPVGPPATIANFLVGALGGGRPTDPMKGRIEGWLSQMGSAIGIVGATNTENEKDDDKFYMGKEVFRELKTTLGIAQNTWNEKYKLKDGTTTTTSKAVLAYETAIQESGNNQNEIKNYWNNLDDASQEHIKRFYLHAQKTKLTYQLAVAWQGGAGGRMVSDQDFRIIHNAIWNLPNGKAQAVALEFIKMAMVRPWLRQRILINQNKQGRNPRVVQRIMEPALQAMYNKAYKDYSLINPNFVIENQEYMNRLASNSYNKEQTYKTEDVKQILHPEIADAAQRRNDQAILEKVE